MELIYTYSESSVRPRELEICKTTVYLRKDIVEDMRTDDLGNKFTFYIYQEAKMSHDEFNEYTSFLAKQNAINGVNDSSNISNLLIGQENGDNNQLIIMEAIADLYDAIAGMM